jgi:hypothetical protein
MNCAVFSTERAPSEDVRFARRDDWTQTDPDFRKQFGQIIETMVGPNGLEPSTSSVSRKRSNQTELRAYIFQAGAASRLPALGTNLILSRALPPTRFFTGSDLYVVEPSGWGDCCS